MGELELFNQAWAAHNWPIVASLIILLAVRLAKTEMAGQIWAKVPAAARPWVPLALGVLSGVAEALVRGTAIGPALVYGVLTGLAAIGVDQAVSKPWNALTATPTEDQKK